MPFLGKNDFSVSRSAKLKGYDSRTGPGSVQIVDPDRRRSLDSKNTRNLSDAVDLLAGSVFDAIKARERAEAQRSKNQDWIDAGNEIPPRSIRGRSIDDRGDDHPSGRKGSIRGRY